MSSLLRSIRISLTHTYIHTYIRRARIYESILNLFNGNKMDHISKIFSKRSFADCNFLLIYWKSIHSIQYFTLAVALYRPYFFRRSLWDGKLVKMFLLLCKCIFNFSLQLIFKSSITFMDSCGYKFYAVFFLFIVFQQHFSRSLDSRRSGMGLLKIVFLFDVTEIFY